MKNRIRNSYDEDIERSKRCPWRTSMRRPMAGPSSVIFIALMTAIYLGAAAVIIVADGRPIFPSRIAIPFH